MLHVHNSRIPQANLPVKLNFYTYKELQPLFVYSYLKHLLVSIEPVVLNELSLPEIHKLANFVGSDFEFDTFLWLLVQNDQVSQTKFI